MKEMMRKKKTINGQATDIALAVVPFFIGTLGIGEHKPGLASALVHLSA
jgi:hypothetical protein